MTSYNPVNFYHVTYVTKLFYVAYNTNKCLFSFSLPGFQVFLSVCCNICLETEIQLLVGESYMFGDVIIWYVQ